MCMFCSNVWFYRKNERIFCVDFFWHVNLAPSSIYEMWNFALMFFPDLGPCICKCPSAVFTPSIWRTPFILIHSSHILISHRHLAQHIFFISHHFISHHSPLNRHHSFPAVIHHSSPSSHAIHITSAISHTSHRRPHTGQHQRKVFAPPVGQPTPDHSLFFVSCQTRMPSNHLSHASHLPSLISKY